MNSVRILWEETVQKLEKNYARREAEQIAYILFEDAFQIPKSAILLYEELKIDVIKLESMVTRLLENEPIQYVTECAHFFGNTFYVNEDVLIPRPETEELVDLIIKENCIDYPKIIDIGTGSGCIPVSLKLNIDGEVYGTDVSPKALSIARKNARQLKADVSFLENDILKERLPIDHVDILISNPPYIPVSDKPEMQPNVLDYEPDLALFVTKENPLIFYKKIAELGLGSLKEGGRLYFEIHEQFGIEISTLMKGFGYQNVKVHKDMQGKDRMISSKI